MAGESQDKMTGKPMIGNPAGVALLDSFPDEEVMQSVAKKMELSETAFVCPTKVGEGSKKRHFEIRWFTPTCEVDLCGHATLASAHTLWSEGVVPENGEISFHSKNDILKSVKIDNYIWLDFPADYVKSFDLMSSKARDVMDVLGLSASEINYIGMGHSDFLIELGSIDAVKNFLPDMDALKEIDIRGFIITASGGDYDFVSRFFAPAFGIDEDPVTGSAHTTLAPYWASKLNKTEMTACQLSHRGGVVKVKLAGDRVLLGGEAETVKVVEL